MANSSPPWDSYRAIMAYRLVVPDKIPGVRPVGIGETFRRALAKLIMRASGSQAKMACSNIQLCAGLKAIIEGATHAVVQWILEKVRAQRRDEEAGSLDE